MKFWHLTSIFRSEKDLLKETLKQSRWQKYHLNFLNLDYIVQIQDRQILDEKIPDDLALEICALSKIKFWLYPQMTPPRLSSYEFRETFPVEELSAKEAFLKFGAHNMEEALEKSYTEIRDN